MLEQKFNTVKYDISFLFRASQHENPIKKFHEICDDKPGYIVIIESEYGHIFGGYTSISHNEMFFFQKF